MTPCRFCPHEIPRHALRVDVQSRGEFQWFRGLSRSYAESASVAQRKCAAFLPPETQVRILPDAPSFSRLRCVHSQVMHQPGHFDLPDIATTARAGG